MFKVKERCCVCKGKLSEPMDKVGYCAPCAKREVTRIKNSLRTSFIGGMILSIVVFLFFTFFRANAYKADYDYVVYGASFYMSSYGIYAAVNNISTLTRVIIYWVAFMIPFGIYIDMGDDSNQGLMALSALMIEFLISAVTGPIKIIHYLWKWRRIRKTLTLQNFISNNNKNYGAEI